MKNIILLSLLTILLFVTACNVSKETAEVEPYKTETKSVENVTPKRNKNLVLVELFTSEG